MIKATIKTKSFKGPGKDTLMGLLNMKVLVGIPQEKISRKDDGINNAELLFIHTNGSVLQGIPARPVIEPAIEDKENKPKILRELKEALAMGMSGDKNKAGMALKRAGMVGQNAARAWFVNPKNGWEPNSPATIAVKGSEKPLIDTGQMRKSIIYVVQNG